MLSDFTQPKAADRRLVPGKGPRQLRVERRQEIVIGVQYAVRIAALQEGIRNERRTATLQTAAQD